MNDEYRCQHIITVSAGRSSAPSSGTSERTDEPVNRRTAFTRSSGGQPEGASELPGERKKSGIRMLPTGSTASIHRHEIEILGGATSDTRKVMVARLARYWTSIDFGNICQSGREWHYGGAGRQQEVCTNAF
jgi:hypothetical protein